MNIGIDIGGRHVGIGLVNSNLKIIDKIEYEIHKDKRSQEGVKIILLKGIDEMCKKHHLFINKDIEKIGIAVCGTIKDGEIKKSVNLNIKDWKIKKELEEVFNLPVVVRNDVKAVALAEKNQEYLQQYEDILFLTIGTGIGGAVILNNKLLKPKRYDGFEFGHMKLGDNKIICKCKRNGCFETYSSITALKRNIMEILNIDKEINGKELYNIISGKLENNDEIKQYIKKYIEILCDGISNLIDIFEPEVVVLGGSIVYYEKMLLEEIKSHLTLFNDVEETPIIQMALLGNDAGMIGAVIGE